METIFTNKVDSKNIVTKEIQIGENFYKLT